MRQKDFWSGLMVMVISLAFLVSTFFMPWKDANFNWYGAPGLVPAILAFLLFFTGLRLFVRSVRGSHFYIRFEEESGKDHILEPAKIFQESEIKLPKYLKSEKLRILIVILWSAVYVFILLGLKINWFGIIIKVHYVIATTIFIGGFILLFKGAGWLKSLLIGMSISAVVWVVFEKVFAVVLP